MKKKILLIVLIAALVFVVPAAAKGKTPVGERINVLFGTPTSYPAGEPFHISHGWLFDLPDHAPVGIWLFRLEVDGVFVEHDFVQTEIISKKPTTITKKYVFNFPGGMTGTHTFTGHWYGSCQVMVDTGYYPGPCPKPNAQIEFWTETLTVTFTP